MKRGRIGSHMRYKGFIIHRGRELERFKQNDITKKAEVRLTWMDYYHKTKNARLTCRHFGLSPDTFYRWRRRYDPGRLSSLEDHSDSRRPQHLRQPTTPLKIVKRIRELREIYPRWGEREADCSFKKGRLLYLRVYCRQNDQEVKGERDQAVCTAAS